MTKLVRLFNLTVRCQGRWNVPSSLWYKTHFSRQLNRWSLRCSWSIACWRCSNYIFILHLTFGFNILRQLQAETRNIKFRNMVRLMLETLRYLSFVYSKYLHNPYRSVRSVGVSVDSSAPLQWRHNECDGVSNHRRFDCLLNRLFRWHRSKKTSKLRVTGFCEGNSPVNNVFPPQKASNAANVSIWRRHQLSDRDSWIIWPKIIKRNHHTCPIWPVMYLQLCHDWWRMTNCYKLFWFG